MYDERYNVFDCPECGGDFTIVLKVYYQDYRYYKKIHCYVCNKIFDLPFTAKDREILG